MAAVSEDEALSAGSGAMKYFSHDSAASADMKCRRLLRRYGVEGYGRFWLLCEALASADWHRLPFETEEDAEVVSDVLMCEPDEARSFIASLGEWGLISADQLSRGVITSDRMVRNSIEFGRKRVGGMRGRGPRKK